MGQLSQKHPTCVVSRDERAEREELAERMIAFLRAQHPHKMPESVAARSGVSAHTIRKMEERRSAPSMLVAIRLGRAYGPEFVHLITGWEWLDPVVQAARIQVLERRRERTDEDIRAVAR